MERTVVVYALGLEVLPVAHVAGVELVAAEEGELDVAAVWVGVDELVCLHKGGVVARLPHGVGGGSSVAAEVLDEVALDMVVGHEEEFYGTGLGDRGGSLGGGGGLGGAAREEGCGAGGERAADEVASGCVRHGSISPVHGGIVPQTRT